DRHRPSPLQPLVTFHAPQRVVLGLALLPGEPDAVDPAVALVEERVVVGEPAGDRDTARGVGSRPIDQQRNEEAGRPPGVRKPKSQGKPPERKASSASL